MGYVNKLANTFTNYLGYHVSTLEYGSSLKSSEWCEMKPISSVGGMVSYYIVSNERFR